MVQIWRNTTRALADRKGVTALEYAVLMTAMIPAVLIAFRALAVKLGDLIASIVF